MNVLRQRSYDSDNNDNDFAITVWKYETYFRLFLGGSDVTPPHSQPWMVALIYNAQGTFLQRQFCGGTLINDSIVLTAAHCITKYVYSLPDPELWKIKIVWN